MSYYKHSELVKKYHISLKTVHNWIDASKRGELDLDLYTKGRRVYVSDDPNNLSVLERLAERGKKYRNSRFKKTVAPSPVFYRLYSPRQILDIITNLNIYRELPRQYNYFGEGAANWDRFALRRLNEKGANTLKSDIELVQNSLNNLDVLLADYERVNVIDIGVGNALPVRELLGHLISQSKLNRYIAIDISETMLHVARRNLEGWFGDKISFEGFVRDMSFERFDDIIVADMLGYDAKKTVNLVLLLGATSTNLRYPADMLRAIRGSMGHKDLFVHTDMTDSGQSRQYFDFNPEPAEKVLSPNHRLLLDMLNINPSFYDVEMGFNKHSHMRFIRVRLKVALTIDFKDVNTSVSLEKGESILLWRAWHRTSAELFANFSSSGFALLYTSTAKDRRYLLTILAVDPGLGTDD